MGMSNFEFLTYDERFDDIARAAKTAEDAFSVAPELCVLACRRALEVAVKWIYSVDKSLERPWKDNLATLVSTPGFKRMLPQGMDVRIAFIRKAGNIAAHDNKKKIAAKGAVLCLENLFYVLDFVAYCYMNPASYHKQDFDAGFIQRPKSVASVAVSTIEVSATSETKPLEELERENCQLADELTQRREERETTYTPKPTDPSEFETRKLYIDVNLASAGWAEGEDWRNEVELKGMPNAAGIGFADYVLYGDDGRPLAVVEAKKTCVDPAVGRQQAKLYADILEGQYGRRPVIFLTNGFDTRIIDGDYPERSVSGIYSKRDLEKLFNLRASRASLASITIDDNISGRYYQKEAIKAVCESFDRDRQRKALLVMATGSGKTRTVISLVDVLSRHGWIKNMLFLADRTSLVVQAYRAFVVNLPSLSVTNMCSKDRDPYARGVFSTYQTIINCVDETHLDDGARMFTPGHFDLVVVDEAHRSIYNKYRDIFDYFDAYVVGLTATPKDEISHNTYAEFGLAEGDPTYGYELKQAVEDGYLVDYEVEDATTKIMDRGITYAELSDSEKEAYEEQFADFEGEMPESISASAVNRWLFNSETIGKVLDALMDKGLKVDYGQNIGKTIIFARSHAHAEAIREVWGRRYPYYPDGYCAVVDNHVKYAQALIDEFSEADGLPRIAVSVDMLDTGIDVPSLLNLVFFKPVKSKAKFNQMIGRGTRLCKGLMDGEDKRQFLIFDWGGNFKFFGGGKKGSDDAAAKSVQQRIFELKVNITKQLQDVAFQTDDLKEFRRTLVDDVLGSVGALRPASGNEPSMAVRLHYKYIERFSVRGAFTVLGDNDVEDLAREVAPIVPPLAGDGRSLRFDALVYGLEAAVLSQDRRRTSYYAGKVKAIAATLSQDCGTVPSVERAGALLQELMSDEALEHYGVLDWEHARKIVRELVPLISPSAQKIVFTSFEDEVIEASRYASDTTSAGVDLGNYRERVAYYVRQHMDDEVINKIHENLPLSNYDLRKLERLLWSELGTKDEYADTYGEEPLGELVRSIVGLDQKAANDAFSDFINDSSLSVDQMFFIEEIVRYVVKHGMMKDLSVLQGAPFDARGSIVDLFDLETIARLRRAIEDVNANATCAA